MGLLAVIADQRGWLSPVRCYIADTVAESLGPLLQETTIGQSNV